MKRAICIFLLLTLCMGLFACAAEPEPVPPISVGFARGDITPTESVPLAGYGNTAKRMSTEVLDPLSMTCIAMSDGTKTVLLYTHDLLISTNNWVPQLRSDLYYKYDIPLDNIMFCATNNHSAPDARTVGDAYKQLFVDTAMDLAEKAIADLTPATLYGAYAETEGMNFTRHYILEDGSVAGEFYGDFSASPIKEHAAQPDNQMVLLKADRTGDKQDILVVNYQAHPNFTSGEKKTQISADFVGVLRNKVEADTQMLCAYFTGATAEVDPVSRIESENHGLDYKGYGEKLAQFAIDATAQMTKLEGNEVQTHRLAYNCEVNHYDEELADQADQVIELWQQTDLETSGELARELGFSSALHAEVVKARPSRPAKKPIELNAIGVGGFGFVTAPYKMYSTNGRYVKDESPTEFTMVFSEANEAWPNIAAKEAYEYGSYESDCSYYAEGMGERLAEIFVSMLELVQ